METENLTTKIFEIHAAISRMEAIQKNDHDMLFGNGQPGVLHNFNERVKNLETFRDTTIGRNGLWATLAAGASILGAELLHAFLWSRGGK